MTGSELRCFVLVLGVIIVEHQTIGLDKKGKKQDASDETLSVNSLDGVQGKLQKSKVKKDSKKTKNTGVDKSVETMNLKDVFVRFINLIQSNRQPGDPCVLLLRISIPQLNRLQKLQMNNSNGSDIADILSDMLEQLEPCITNHSYKDIFSNTILPAVLLVFVLGLTYFRYNNSMFGREKKARNKICKKNDGVKVAKETDWQ